MDELIYLDYTTSWFQHNFDKIYQNIYAEIFDKDGYYNILIYCPYAKDKDSIKKIKILNKYLLIHIGEREYIMPGLVCVIYLPLPNNIENILR